MFTYKNASYKIFALSSKFCWAGAAEGYWAKFSILPKAKARLNQVSFGPLILGCHPLKE